MILGGEKKDVVANMRRRAQTYEETKDQAELNAKVEVDDPKVTEEEKAGLASHELDRRGTIWHRFNCSLCSFAVGIFSHFLNRKMEITGMENIDSVTGGAVITCNHYNPLDSTPIRFLAKKKHHRKLYIVSEPDNLAMTGWLGYVMHYDNVIPISPDAEYMEKRFLPLVNDLVKKGEWVLIFPEQEMWFNYRKPRPTKRGAYYFASKCGVPIISCFVEIREQEEMDNHEFKKTQYILHVLPTLYPKASLTVRENSMWMKETDYAQKKKAYEQVYGKPLSYAFSNQDVAGWVPPKE